MRTIDPDSIGERKKGCTTVNWRHNVMDDRCQMTSARPSTSPRRQRTRPVRPEAAQSVPCHAMMTTVDCAMDWRRRLRR